MTTLAVTSVNSLLCHASTCFRIGSKFRRMRSTPTEMQSMSENDSECFASTGVKDAWNNVSKLALSGTFEADFGPGRHHVRSATYVRVEYASLNFAESLHLDEQAIVARLRKGIGE